MRTTVSGFKGPLAGSPRAWPAPRPRLGEMGPARQGPPGGGRPAARDKNTDTAEHGLDFICLRQHAVSSMRVGRLPRRVRAGVRSLHRQVQDEVFAVAHLLKQFGPMRGRPRVDTLNGSRHANMKEMRFASADGEWRLAFAFDPMRKAVLLVAGDKSGVSAKRFYRALIRKADERF